MKEKIMNHPVIRFFTGLRISRWACSNPIIGKFCTYEIMSYLICGVLTTVVNYAVYFLFRSFKTSAAVSNIAAWVAAVLFAYFSNKIFVFLSDDWSRACLIREIIPFISCRLASFFLDEAFVIVTIQILGLNEFLMKLVSNVFVLIINYFGSKILVFRKKKGGSANEQNRKL